MVLQKHKTMIGMVRISCVLYLVLVFSACSSGDKAIDPAFHFSFMKEGHTHIDFNNQLTESDSVNFLTNQYIYIGSGVGIADFNRDGLQDLFFAGEQVSSKLYLNTGDFRFKDITEMAGVQTSRWCTGVSIVDINNDELPDIYVCASHSRDPLNRKNYLFINHTNIRSASREVVFREEAAAYGLDDPGFSTQAAFFDYDRDGDLDMYLMNHNVFQNQPNNIVVTNAAGTSVAADKLFRNEGIPPGGDHPIFKDVSAEAGIRDFGYGLGIAISDLNQDGWPDVYIANDFLSNDLMWLNQKNGRFVNAIASSMHHQSYNSMGVDAADINNDQLPDIAVLDMQPETNYRKKTMFAGTNPIKYELEQKSGNYQPQFTRNMLQLHQGMRTIDSLQQPFFSEIGQLAGISETDWSWSVLMADFDNDGWKDMQVTNGLAKDLTNNDFLFFRSSLNQEDLSNNNPVSGQKNDQLNTRVLRKQLDEYGSVRTNNYFFRNNGNLQFSNATEAVGMARPSISHGAAYGDLDNDGDLDLVINNMNEKAFIWRNDRRSNAKDTVANFLSVTLKGPAGNGSGFGARLTLYNGNDRQFLEQNPVKGYLSTMDDRLHFGLKDARSIDSIRVEWPDGNMQLLKNVPVNQFLTVAYRDAAKPVEMLQEPGKTLFRDAAREMNLVFRHDEMSYFDYGIQRLLPQKYSQLGPPMATADVNGDGRMDLFIGGGSFQSGRIFLQSPSGHFTYQELIGKNKTSEDLGAVFFDADGDADMDLLISEGSNEFGESASLNVPRLYLNNGNGMFSLDSSAIPAKISTMAQAVTAGDVDGDGDADLFIGGRMLANKYPQSPRSYLLRNDKGKFTDVTRQVCPALEHAGMITAAVWTDINNDRQPDLVLAGEWMPVRFFTNKGGRLEESTAAAGTGNLQGMWRSLAAADLDGDGDMDLVAGNMGNNNKYHASSQRPMQLFARDIDGNGTVDLVPAYHIKNEKGHYELFPSIDLTEFSQEVPTIKKKYLLNEAYSGVRIADLFKGIGKEDLLEFRCDTTATLILENTGNGIFRMKPLPLEVQFAPVNAVIARDLDGDAIVDLLLAGNEYQAEIGSGRYDASYGLFLKGKGKLSFEAMRPVKSGFIVEGDVKSLGYIPLVNGTSLIVAGLNNNFMRGFIIPPQNLK